MQNCVGEVLLLGIFAVTAYRDWKEQMICVYVPLAVFFWDSGGMWSCF